LFRPYLEALEDRLALAEVTFTGADFALDPLGHWSNPNNWLGGAVAQAGDDVDIGAAAANRASTQDIANLSLKTLTLDAGFGNGFLDVPQNLTVQNDLTLLGGGLTVTGSTLTARIFNHNAGRPIGGTGTISIAGTAQVPGLLQVLAPSIIGVAQLNVDGNSILVIDAATEFSTTHVANSGLTRWVSGNTTFSNSADFINHGTFDAVNSVASVWGGVGPSRGVFVNRGTVTKTTPLAVTMNSVYTTPVVGPTTRVLAGTMTFTGGGSEYGSFVVDAGTTMRFSGGNYVLNNGAGFSGDGTVNIVGAASFEVPTAQSVSSSAALTFNAAITNLKGGGTFISTKSLLWNSGEVRDLAQFSVSTAFSLDSTNTKTLTDTTLRNSAAAVWSDGNIALSNAVFENMNSATFDIAADDEMSGSGTFRNLSGTVRKGVGTGVTRLDVLFDNRSLLLLQGQHVKFDQGVTQSFSGTTDLGGGTLELGVGKVFNMTGGNLRGGGEIDGDLSATGGTVDIGDNPNKRTLKVTGNCTKGSGALLRVTVASDGAGGWAFGLLDVVGTATLAGQLTLLLPDGNPPANTTGTIVKAATRNGTLAAPPGWTVTPVGNDLTLKKD
jgi:hypothetical protein